MKKEPDLIVLCAKCGEKYVFEEFDMVDEIPMNTPCRKCGFHLFLHTHLRFKAMNILSGEPNFAKIADNPQEVVEYLDEMVGLRKIKKNLN